MRALFTQFSGLVGLLTFLNQLMGPAPLEKTIYLGLSAGLTVYLVLLLGDLAIHRILESAASLQKCAEGNAEAATGAATTTENGGKPERSRAPDAPPISRTDSNKNKEALAV
jgi:hypothetical protein